MLGRENPSRVFIGNLAEGVQEAVIYELCIQFGPIINLVWPRGRREDIAAPATGPANTRDYCFVDFAAVEDAKYFSECLQKTRIKLFGQELRTSMTLEKTGQDGTGLTKYYDLYEIGAKVVVLGLDPTLTEFEISQYFEKFGPMAVPPRMIRDGEGNFVGRCILSFRSFHTSDLVIRETHQRVFRDRIIAVDYALKEDGSGEKHGSSEERENALLIQQEEERHQQKVDQYKAEYNATLKQQQKSDTSWAQKYVPPRTK